MEAKIKRRAARLGGRIGFAFFIAAVFFVALAYFILSNNFQDLFTDYTVTLVQSMVDQGVTTIEYELRVSKEEARVLAESMSAPKENPSEVVFPTEYSESKVLRMVYVSQNVCVASDGRQLDISSRKDILEAYDGNTSLYGPYFNEDGEYVVCYSAPVFQNNEVAGVLSIEKDGYFFCELIKDIRFINSGESYIINEEGTDIAVSNLEHLSWVDEQYNAQRLLNIEEDSETASILALEKKGLEGERGVGTYYWEDGLCYVVYAPISSVRWVLLGGLRQEEIDSMMQKVLFSTITKGPALGIILGVFLLLTGLIIFWILSSMKESAEVNEKLNRIANYDPLTGVMNRNSYNAAFGQLLDEALQSLVCIYIDVNGLHEINNHLGHHAGDLLLKTVAQALCKQFPLLDIYRIGGDEFVVFCRDANLQEITDKMQLVRHELKISDYEISVGIERQQEKLNINTLIKGAEEAMQRDKQRYYQENGKERQSRVLDQELEQMVMEKQDADAFLSILAPEFRGVYFVDLGHDTIRHLYITPYFKEILREANEEFSKALLLYISRTVKPEYHRPFEKFCDYSYVELKLGSQTALEFTYQKIDGSWLKLRILKFKTYTSQCRETLWIFSNAEKG